MISIKDGVIIDDRDEIYMIEDEEKKEIIEEEKPKKKIPISQLIQKLTLSEKVKIAMKADKEARGVLIKDPNKQIALAILGNQGITAGEIESIANSRTSSEEVLRIISGNREWVKNYAIINALVSNPRTPVSISMNLIKKLNKKEITLLSKNHNIPAIIRITAKRRLDEEK